MSEFQLKSFGFSHVRIFNFVESQWIFISPKLFTCYRVTIAISMVVWAISDFATEWLNSYSGHPYYWLLMATNWAFMFMVIALIMLAFVNILTNCHDVRSSTVAGYKVCWIFYNIACNSVLTTSIIYLFALVNSDQDIFNTTQSKLKHGLNAMIIIVDLMICAIEIRLLHFIYPFFLGIFYTLVLVIYYSAGGVGPKHKPYIYEALYWKFPGRAIVAVICVVIMSILVHLFLYIFVQARVWLYKLIYGDSVSVYESKLLEDSDQAAIINNEYNSYSTIE